MAKVPRKSTSKRFSKSPTKKSTSKVVNNTSPSKSIRNRRFSIIESDEDDDDDSSEDSDDDSEDADVSADYIPNGGLYRSKRLTQAKKHMDPIISSSEDEDDSEDEVSSSSDDENIDFVQLTKEKRAKAMKAAKALKNPKKISKKKNKKGSDNEEFEIISDKELDDELVDAVLEEEEKKLSDYESLDEDEDDDNGSIIDFKFDFDNEGDDDGFQVVAKNNSPINEEEDLGEEVDDLNKDLSTIQARVSDEQVTMDVPKFDENDIDSDADYEFNKDDLIQTLQNDNDDLELQAFGNSDDDYDFLLPQDDPFFQDDNYLMKEETEAMVGDFNDGFSSSANVTPRHSIVNTSIHDSNNEEAIEDEDSKVDESQEKLKYLPAPEDGDDDDDYDDDDQLDELAYEDLFLNGFSNAGVPIPPVALVTDDEDEEDQENASVEDEDDEEEVSDDSDVDVFQYFFSSGESEDGQDDNDSGDETDEDATIRNLPRAKFGSKVAKEVLSSSKNNFRAPVLGTFSTSKNQKPFSIIDGYSTRFLHPSDDNRTSVLKGTRIRTMSTARRQSNAGTVPPSQQQQADPLALDELLNISEFEDEENEDPGSFDWNLFKHKRIPLTAFRNKGLINNNNSIYNQPEPTRKYSLTDHSRRHKSQSASSKRSSKKSKHSKASPRKKKDLFDDFIVTTAATTTIPNNISNKLKTVSTKKKIKKLINNSNSNNSKARFRRQSIVEARAEGLRTTKSGLFSEETLNDVEAFLVDIGQDDDLSFLFTD